MSCRTHDSARSATNVGGTSVPTLRHALSEAQRELALGEGTLTLAVGWRHSPRDPRARRPSDRSMGAPSDDTRLSSSLVGPDKARGSPRGSRGPEVVTGIATVFGDQPTDRRVRGGCEVDELSTVDSDLVVIYRERPAARGMTRQVTASVTLCFRDAVVTKRNWPGPSVAVDG